MAINYKIIGKRIKEVRKQKGLSQEKLAEMAEISTQYMSQIETAARNVSFRSLLNIAKALEVSMDELLYGNQPITSGEYLKEMNEVLENCNTYEKRVLYELIVQSKKILQDNRGLLKEDDD